MRIRFAIRATAAGICSSPRTISRAGQAPDSPSSRFPPTSCAPQGHHVPCCAHADWQIYQRDRPLYGRTWEAWHTVEGPCVVAHAGRYFCFYSGGNWQTHEYGVSYATAEHPLGPWQHAPESGPAVLRQSADALGPGHNAYVGAPDGRTELLVYHAWDPQRTARRMCIDPLVWTPAGPRCLGPSTTPREL